MPTICQNNLRIQISKTILGISDQSVNRRTALASQNNLRVLESSSIVWGGVAILTNSQFPLMMR